MLSLQARPSPHEQTAGDFLAVLKPHASLSDASFETAVTGMLALSILASVVANPTQVWPVGVAVGLTGLLTASLSVVWRAGLDRSEEVRLCGSELCVRRFRKGRLVDQRRFDLDRTRLLRRDDPDHGCLGLRLERQGKRFGVGADLPPGERDRFARSLVAAIAAAGRHLPVVQSPTTACRPPENRGLCGQPRRSDPSPPENPTKEY